MKEMTIEQKAKAYDEALKVAHRLYEQGTITESLSYIFPELKESEDERIRKRLIENFSNMAMFSYWGATNKIQVSDIIAWLEKQGEQKSVDEVLKIRQELYQSGYNDGYKHGQEDIIISLQKETIDALEHFVRSIGESGYASPYDNRTKLVYTLLERLKQIVK